MQKLQRVVVLGLAAAAVIAAPVIGASAAHAEIGCPGGDGGLQPGCSGSIGTPVPVDPSDVIGGPGPFGAR